MEDITFMISVEIGSKKRKLNTKNDTALFLLGAQKHTFRKRKILPPFKNCSLG